MNKQFLPRLFLTILLCIAGSFLLPVYVEAADKSGAQTGTEAAGTGTSDSQQQIIITSITDVSYMVGYAIPTGTDWDEFFNANFNDDLWQNSVPCETIDGRTVNADVTWSNPRPNTSVACTVSLIGTVILPENAILADGMHVSKVYCTVSIQHEDRPSLDAWYINYGTITFPWINSGVTDLNAIVLYRQDGSDWSTSDYFYCDDQAVYLNINGLNLGSSYEIQVVWDGGSTDIFSFTYDGSVSVNYLVGGDRDGGDAGGNGSSDVSQLPPDADPDSRGDSGGTQNPQTDPDNQSDSVAQDDSDSQSQAESQMDPEPQTRPNAGYQTPSAASSGSGNDSTGSDSDNDSDSGCDSTGSDSNNGSDSGCDSTGSNSNSSSCGNSAGNSSDTGSDSSNSSDTSSDSSNSSDSNAYSSEPDDTFMETITDTYSLISGTRLNLMRQNGSVRFSKQGITVTLAALDALDITNNSQFYIEIRNTENGFSFLVELDGESITELSDTIVMLPCDAPDEGSVLTLKGSDGSTITGSYDDASGIATFTVQHSGVYTLTETQNDDGAIAADDADSDPDDTTAATGDADSDSDDATAAAGDADSDFDGSSGTSVASGSDSSTSATASSDKGSDKTTSQLRILASTTTAAVLVVVLVAIFLISLCHKGKFTGSKLSHQGRKSFRNTATSH